MPRALHLTRETEPVISATSGLLSTLVIEEIIPQTHQGRDARLATVFLVGGFALFGLLAAYVH